MLLKEIFFGKKCFFIGETQLSFYNLLNTNAFIGNNVQKIGSPVRLEILLLVFLRRKLRNNLLYKLINAFLLFVAVLC